MLLLLLLLIPLIAMLINSVRASYVGYNLYEEKSIAFSASILNLLVSLVVWILFDFSQNQFQFVKESYK
jgi:NADH:ubiquinone oxidoreductase subunit 4 (subunit M)